MAYTKNVLLGAFLGKKMGICEFRILFPGCLKIITTEIHLLGVESKEEKTVNIVEE
jgi:hypothetical protein